MGILSALSWIVRGDLYECNVIVRNVELGKQMVHSMYIRAHSKQGAKVRAFYLASRRFQGHALEVTTCYDV